MSPGLLRLETVPTRLWERYLEAPGRARVPQALRRCWDRVRTLGAPSAGLAHEAVLEAAALHERRERLDPLLRVLPGVLDPAVALFGDQDHVLVLADRDGVVLQTAGGGDFADTARRVRLIQGSSWSESLRGTNAIGTAIAEDRPVTVRGAAHFARPNHTLSCHAAPIHDPHTGEVIAVLDATSSVHAPTGLVTVAVLSLAQGLERAMHQQAMRKLGRLERALAGPILSRFSGPALLLSPAGTVHQANAAALDAFPHLHRLGRAGVLSPVRARSVELIGLDGADLRAGIGQGQPWLTPDGRYWVELEPLADRDGRMMLVAAFLRPAEQVRTPPPPPCTDPFDALVGTDPAMVALRARARRLAASELPVLLLAETGTGKGSLAKCIHRASPRSTAPFVAFNCGAVTGSLLESELFGYAPGAFTGASPSGGRGRLPAADGGTLFLDEVAEMPPSLQVALLRFLDDGAYVRVGDTLERHADVRVVCATCRDLPTLVREGAFREDLFYRIQGATLTLPPLRERADVALLARALLAEQAVHGVPATLSPTAEAHLANHPWPGNVRQLKSALQLAQVLAGPGAVLQPGHLPASDQAIATTASAPPTTLDEAERGALLRALDAAGGNVAEAARTLGVARSTVYRLMRKHGL